MYIDKKIIFRKINLIFDAVNFKGFAVKDYFCNEEILNGKSNAEYFSDHIYQCGTVKHILLKVN